MHEFAQVLSSEREDEEVDDYFGTDVLFDGTEEKCRAYLALILTEARENGSNPVRRLGCECESLPRVYTLGGGAAGFVKVWIAVE